MSINNKYFMQSVSENIWADSYKWSTDTSIEDTWRRVSKSLASVEKDKDLWENKFYELLQDFKYLPGGRILSNLGTGLSSTCAINCFVSSIAGPDADSLNQIYAELTRQGTILKSEGGYGCNFSVLRPQGATIYGIGVDSPGAVKFMELWDKSSEIVTQGSGTKKSGKAGKNKIRKGAQMGVLECWHPDIENFITAKQAPGVLTKFNISVGITDSFMKAVKAHKPWVLEFPDTTHTMYRKFWDGNLANWKKLTNNATIVYHTYTDANELWDKIINCTYNRNEPGILFLDRINDLNNLKYFGEDIRCTNPCLTGDTLVVLSDGSTQTIEQLAELSHGDVSFDVFSAKHTYKNNWEIERSGAVAFCSGTKHIINILLENNSVISCTPDHRLALEDGSYIEARDSIGKCIVSLDKNLPLNNSRVISSKVKGIIDFNKCEKVYDLSVANNNNFFILTKSSDDNRTVVLVHNCGEIPLPRNGSCVLSSINLTQYINSGKTNFDYSKLSKDIPTMVRFLDNVIDVTNFPLKDHEKEAKAKRRIGVGYTGYASALQLMGITYGSAKAIELTHELCSFVVNKLYQASSELAKEKGTFEIYDAEKYLKSEFINTRLSDETISKIKKNGIRNSHLTTCAPTGTTSLLANNVSSGLEPIVSLSYVRTISCPKYPEGLEPAKVDWLSGTCSSKGWEVISEGDEVLFRISHNGIIYKLDRNRGLCKEETVMDYSHLISPCTSEIKTLFNLTIDEHVNPMNVFAKYIDASISKTVNVPENISFEDFKKVYMTAYDTGNIKGITTYRFGTMASVVSSKSEATRSKRHAEKRPEKLPCDVHRMNILVKNDNGKKESQKWVVFIGLMDDKPYEVFAGKVEDVTLPKHISKGTLVKIKRGKYSFEYEGEILIKNITKTFSNDEYDAFSRMISTTLRHEVPLEFVIDQLHKAKGTIVDFNKAIIIAIKKYIKNGTSFGTCDVCGGKLVYIDGCVQCKNCSISKCG